MNLLGIKQSVNKEYILSEISKYLFEKSHQIASYQKKHVFDINLDYKYYFPDFLKYNINLNKDDIDWWEFNSILNAIINDKNSNMYQIISYREYEKPSKNIKTQEEKKHRFYMEMKRKYALYDNKNIENGFEKMWNYVEKKVGENKE